MRAGPDDKQVVVRTEVRGKGDRSSSTTASRRGDDGWKIYDVNVLGVAGAELHQQLCAGDRRQRHRRLIAKLAERNKSAAANNGTKS